MSTESPSANRALEKAKDNGLNIGDLQKDLRTLGEELRYLVAFNHRLLDLLRPRLALNDADLDFLIRHAEAAETKRELKPGEHVAPLCRYCDRSMQEDSPACIYCGRLQA